TKPGVVEALFYVELRAFQLASDIHGDCIVGRAPILPCIVSVAGETAQGVAGPMVAPRRALNSGSWRARRGASPATVLPAVAPRVKAAYSRPKHPRSRAQAARVCAGQGCGNDGYR